MDKELQALEARGVQLIDKKGRAGLAGRVAFLHPKSTKGLLLQIGQKL